MGVGIPGLRGGDHVGVTVPDMEQAHAFFTGVLGCDFVYSLPEMRHDDDWMADHLNVDPRAVVAEVRFYRCGFGLNFEVFEYQPGPDQRPQPRNSDLGGHHVALYVDDLDRSRAFYERLFGFVVVFHDDRMCAMEVPGEQVLLLFRHGMTDRQLEAKFSNLATGILPDDKARRLIDLCRSVETLDDAGDIARAATAA